MLGLLIQKIPSFPPAVPDPIAFLSQTSAKSRAAAASLNATASAPSSAPAAVAGGVETFGSPHVKARLPSALTGGSALFLMLLGLAVVVLQV